MRDLQEPMLVIYARYDTLTCAKIFHANFSYHITGVSQSERKHNNTIKLAQK